MDSVNVESVGFILVCWFLTVENYCCMHIFCRDSCVFFVAYSLRPFLSRKRRKREHFFVFTANRKAPGSLDRFFFRPTLPAAGKVMARRGDVDISRERVRRREECFLLSSPISSVERREDENYDEAS